MQLIKGNYLEKFDNYRHCGREKNEELIKKYPPNFSLYTKDKLE